MSRRRLKIKRILAPDPVYNSKLVELFVRQIMKNGKKLLAYSIIYKSLKDISEITKKEPLLVLEQAVRNVTPIIELKTRRKRGSTFQIPTEVQPNRGLNLSIRWILAACRKIRGRPMNVILTTELIDAFNKTGHAIKIKEDIQKIAEANKTVVKK